MPGQPEECGCQELRGPPSEATGSLRAVSSVRDTRGGPGCKGQAAAGRQGLGCTGRRSPEVHVGGRGREQLDGLASPVAGLELSWAGCPVSRSVLPSRRGPLRRLSSPRPALRLRARGRTAQVRLQMRLLRPQPSAGWLELVGLSYFVTKEESGKNGLNGSAVSTSRVPPGAGTATLASGGGWGCPPLQDAEALAASHVSLARRGQVCVWGPSWEEMEAGGCAPPKADGRWGAVSPGAAAGGSATTLVLGGAGSCRAPVAGLPWGGGAVSPPPQRGAPGRAGFPLPQAFSVLLLSDRGVFLI